MTAVTKNINILKQQWTIEEISIFSNSSHLEWRAGLSDTNLKGTHPRTIPNFADMILGWPPFKIVSDSPAFHSRWLLLLKIEISSIVHCCFSISQNELKF
jgi:hypothetical protein